MSLLEVVVARLRAAGCVFAEDEARLLLDAATDPDAATDLDAATDPGQLSAMLERREAGDPLEYILGWAEFRGLRITVAPGVFVPRRRTGYLAGQAAALARPGSVVVDLCCGSGAIGAAVAAEVPGVELHSADIDPLAVRCARGNVPRVYQGDLYRPLPAALRGRIAVLVANAPYVPTGALGTLPPEAREYEPPVALDGGADGLDVLRRVIDGAPDWLAPGGHILVESGVAQAPPLLRAMAAVGLAARVASDEDLGATVVIGTAGPVQPERCRNDHDAD